MIADDIIYGDGIFHTTYQGPFPIMHGWNLEGFIKNETTERVVENQIIGDLDIEWLQKPSIDGYAGGAGCLVMTITDYIDYEGANIGLKPADSGTDGYDTADSDED